MFGKWTKTLLHYYLSIIHWLASPTASREVEVWKELCPGFSAFPNCGLPTGDFGVCTYISMLTRETRERCSARGIGAWTQPNRVWIKFIHEESILFSRLFNLAASTLRRMLHEDTTMTWNDIHTRVYRKQEDCLPSEVLESPLRNGTCDADGQTLHHTFLGGNWRKLR